MHNPSIIILDEATSGLDPIMQEEFYKILLEEKEAGKTIFYSTHILTELTKICDRVGIIKESKLIKVEDTANIFNGDIKFITITTSDTEKLKKVLKDSIITENKKTLKFVYKESANDLIKLLAKYNIEKILIEDAKIEDIFMHYYK